MFHLVYERFDGITWYIQRVMNELYAITPSGGSCTPDLTETAIDNILRSNEFSYQSLLYQLPPKQKTLFMAICKSGKATSIMSSDFIHRWHLPSSY